jgi:hypothetical protein
MFGANFLTELSVTSDDVIAPATHHQSSTATEIDKGGENSTTITSLHQQQQATSPAPPLPSHQETQQQQPPLPKATVLPRTTQVEFV